MSHRYTPVFRFTALYLRWVGHRSRRLPFVGTKMFYLPSYQWDENDDPAATAAADDDDFDLVHLT